MSLLITLGPLFAPIFAFIFPTFALIFPIFDVIFLILDLIFLILAFIFTVLPSTPLSSSPSSQSLNTPPCHSPDENHGKYFDKLRKIGRRLSVTVYKYKLPQSIGKVVSHPPAPEHHLNMLFAHGAQRAAYNQFTPCVPKSVQPEIGNVSIHPLFHKSGPVIPLWPILSKNTLLLGCSRFWDPFPKNKREINISAKNECRNGTDKGTQKGLLSDKFIREC